MPIYEYKCANCGHKLDELQSFSEPPLTTCPVCGQESLKRLIGAGAGLIFKGSGFYLTDYKKNSASDTKPSTSTPNTETTTESKSEHKTNSKNESEKDSPKSENK